MKNVVSILNVLMFHFVRGELDVSMKESFKFYLPCSFYHPWEYPLVVFMKKLVGEVLKVL